MLKWYCSRRSKFVAISLVLFFIMNYVSIHDDGNRQANLDIARRSSILEFIETKLEEALKEDKGTGCKFPNLDPFDKEVTQFDKPPPTIVCNGQDWVKCYMSECKVPESILRNFEFIKCTYRDILYHTDFSYNIGKPNKIVWDGVYTLRKSDHVKIRCIGKQHNDTLQRKWEGHATGFRKEVDRVESPPGREDSLDVLIFGFDSTSKNGFMRRMPKSYKFLTEEMGATVLQGYNIVGDGTPAALFPILTGKTELELPDVRKKSTYQGSLDDLPFIFYKLKEDGYRTAYFEDMPWVGTFQFRFKGFKKQPVDHYLRAFLMEEYGKRLWTSSTQKYCLGDTLQYKLMMNITEQFFKLDGKHFAFTFVADITHDDFNMISIADEDTRRFLQAFKDSGRMDKTLLIVMGDHGPRYANVRKTLQGKFEERMPLLAIRLPEVLKRSRPEVAAILKNNSQVLTTPHDIHATILDAMGLRKYWNGYKIRGADLTRALSLLEPIPSNRSCSEAGIEPHWCACVAWDRVDAADHVTGKVARAFLHFINELTESVRSRCVPRTLTAISWVMRRKAKSEMLQFTGSRDSDGFLGTFHEFNTTKDYYQIKMEVGPGSGAYEASATYLRDEDKFVFDSRDISRINAYNDEPSCISATHPHLNMYCYCDRNN